MRSVNIGELRDQLSGFLQAVRNGEEIVVRDRSVPVARILPFRTSEMSDREARLVASGAMRMPEAEIDWKAFFKAVDKAGTVSREAAMEAAIAGRGDR